MDTFAPLLRLEPGRLVLIVAGIALLFAVERWRCGIILRRWCDEHGYRLRRMRRRLAPFGPFPLASRHQVIWRIEADDLKLGGTRRGHARVGGFFSGLWSPDVAVEWQFSAAELSDGRPLAG